MMENNGEQTGRPGDGLFPGNAESGGNFTGRLQERREAGDASGVHREENDADLLSTADDPSEGRWRMDKNLCFTFTDAACEKISGGFKTEDFIGRTLLEFLTPEGIEHLWRINNARVKKEGRGVRTDVIEYELQMMRKDGTYFWAGIRSRPQRDARGDVVGYSGTMRDISVYKRQEAERLRLEDLLQKEQKMAAVGKLAGRVAQELNDILAGALGHSEILLAEHDSAGSAWAAHVEKIIGSGKRAEAIIFDLLLMTRKDAESRRPVDVNGLFSGCREGNAFQVIGKRCPEVSVHLDLEPSLRSVEGGARQLERSLMNLLMLSCENAGPGGAVSVATRTVYFGVPAGDDDRLWEGEYVAVSLADNGRGMADEDIRHIFEPFYAMKAMQKGFSGLELTVAREVIRDHNGFIDVSGRVGCGTTFTVYLPVARRDTRDICRMMPQTSWTAGLSTIN
ncbi:MAG: PAS domain S-box protein [Syntrophaceae bacterium]|nr:PAS domain S-box protein [Syntrophaceae bacterium]